MSERQVYINQREARALIRYASRDPDIRHLLIKLIERVGGARYAFGVERCPYTGELELELPPLEGSSAIAPDRDSGPSSQSG